MPCPLQVPYFTPVEQTYIRRFLWRGHGKEARGWCNRCIVCTGSGGLYLRLSHVKSVLIVYLEVSQQMCSVVPNTRSIFCRGMSNLKMSIVSVFTNRASAYGAVPMCGWTMQALRTCRMRSKRMYQH